MPRIYLDYAATSPVLPEARAAMEQWSGEEFGNPSSTHAEGRRAREAIDEAREVISGTLGCLFGEVCFTSGGTESANLAILGAALGSQNPRRKRIMMSAAEHHCVLHTRPTLERLGFVVESVPVDRGGRTSLDALESALDDTVLLVAAMHANNELGSIQDPLPIAQRVHSAGALFFCDAVQTFLSVPWDQKSLGADLISVSAHKVGGPKGVGALFVRAGTPMKPWVVGGGQERELRGGTENIAGIIGFAAAVRVCLPTIKPRSEAKRAARDAFFQELAAVSPIQLVQGVDAGSSNVLVGHAHLRFPGLPAESMLIALDRAGVSCSSGAACSSGSLEPSHVLLACGCSEPEALEGLRFTFGSQTTIDEAREAARRVAHEAGRVAAAKGRTSIPFS